MDVSRWPFAKLCFVVGALVNLCLGWAIPAFPMFQRLARPIFLVANYRNIQKIFGSMVRTAPEVARVTVLLLLHITLHSAAAYTLFGGMSFDSCTAPRTTSLCSPFTRNCTEYVCICGGKLVVVTQCSPCQRCLN